VNARVCLPAGANPSNGAPLLFACQYDEPCAARLIEAGADVNDFYAETHETCLHAAVRGNNLWIIHQLLRHGADPTRRDARDMTPADLAAELDNPDLSAMLRKAEVPRGWNAIPKTVPLFSPEDLFGPEYWPWDQYSVTN
jgi:ankyrin repeat protein